MLSSNDPNYALAVAGLGETYWRHYELDRENRWASQAQTACEKAIGMDSNQAESHACLAMVYAGTGKCDNAVDEYRRAVEIEPANDDAIRGLASAYARLGKTEDAEKTFQVAIALRPQYWKGYNSLGGLYVTEGRYEDAVKMFSQVVSLSPDSFRGYSNLGATYIRLGQYPEAVKALEQSIKIRPTEDAFSNLGAAFYSLRQFENAATSYAEAAKLNDQVYVVWGNLGDCVLLLRKTRGCNDCLSKSYLAGLRPAASESSRRNGPKRYGRLLRDAWQTPRNLYLFESGTTVV